MSGVYKGYIKDISGIYREFIEDKNSIKSLKDFLIYKSHLKHNCVLRYSYPERDQGGGREGPVILKERRSLL